MSNKQELETAMSLSEVVVTEQDSCSVSVHLTQLTVLPDHIILGHRHNHSAGEARKAKSCKAGSNLWVPEKKFSAPAADPRLSFRWVTAAETSSRPAEYSRECWKGQEVQETYEGSWPV